MTLNINWALFASVVSALAGAVGVVITPIYGATLANNLGDILTSLAGLLAAIGAFHVTSVVAASAKAKALYKLQRGAAIK
jgi:hypothetical protein